MSSNRLPQAQRKRRSLRKLPLAMVFFFVLGLVAGIFVPAAHAAPDAMVNSEIAAHGQLARDVADLDGASHQGTGDGSSEDSPSPGAEIDIDDSEGLHTNTGAGDLIRLSVSGLLSVAAGITAWQISRRRRVTN